MSNKFITFEFSSETIKWLDEIKTQTNAASYGEVIRNALRVHKWLREIEAEGNKIGIVKDDVLVKTVAFIY